MRLVINGNDIDLFDDSTISQTKQVNDVGDIKTRQTNFTKSFKLPKTANNVKAFNFLSLIGNQSNIPYQKNETYLFDDSGECYIYKGWSVVKDTTDTFNCHIYDGTIDFYKSIENKVLTDIGLQQLNHIKNLESVVQTWTDLTLPYRYNVADYNGKMIFDTDKLNIDYLIPSVKVKWLWDRIFSFADMTYEGDAFASEKFTNLFITYPKTISAETEETEPVHTWDFNGAPFYAVDPNSIFSQFAHYSNKPTHNPVVNNNYLSSSPVDPANNEPAGTIITVEQTGLYKFTFDVESLFVTSPNGNTDDLDHNIDIVITKFLPQGGIDFIEVVSADNIQGEASIQTYYVNLTQGDKFDLRFMKAGDPEGGFFFNWLYRITGNMDIIVENVLGNSVDFGQAFIGFSIRDFVNEVLVRLSLTPHPDNFNRNIKFLTTEETILSETTEDWTDKFVRKLSEKYIYSNYGQKNKFAYKYNDKEGNYNDGFININNVNLKDEVTAFQSNIYSPENTTAFLINRAYNVYKFWEKQVKDDATIEYKPLENRFYFMRSDIVVGSLDVGSELHIENQTVNSYPVESYDSLSFQEVIEDFYGPLNTILNKSKLMRVLMNLSPIDVIKLDFKLPVFIEQLGGYFLKNKISNYKKGRLTKVELIKIEKAVAESENNNSNELPKSISTNPIVLPPGSVDNPEWRIVTFVTFHNYTPQSAQVIVKQMTAHPINGGEYTSLEFTVDMDSSINIATILFPENLTNEQGWYEVTAIDNDDLESYPSYIEIALDENANSISMQVANDPNLPNTVGTLIERDLTYTFNNFQPTEAILIVQAYDITNGLNVGLPTQHDINELAQDVAHTIQNQEFYNGGTSYKLTIITNVHSEVYVTYIF